MNLTVTVALTIDSYDPVLVGPRLQDVATGGIGDPFILLPGVLWCWVSFARAFLLALPREASLVALTDPINNQTSGPSTLTFDFDRTDHRSTSGRRSFIFETCS